MRDKLSYTAGVMDSEGTVCMVFSQGRHALRVSISNSSQVLMDWLCSEWPNVGIVNDYGNGQFAWRVQTNQTVEFLEAILPYLLIKQRHATLGIAFLKERPKQYYRKAGFKGNPGLPPEELERRQQIYDELKALNGRKTGPYIKVSLRHQ